MSVVVVVPHARVGAWPKYETRPGERSMPLALALSDTFESDAHVVSYYGGHGCPRRLSTEAIGRREILMLAAIIDVDGHDAPDVAAWFEGERPKIQRVRDATGAFCYRTRSGYRFVSLLPEPLAIVTPDDAICWSRFYVGWVEALRAFGIAADPKCKDWPHLFRLPRATRDVGGAPEQHETIGDPRDLGTWTIDPVFPAEPAPRKVNRSSAAPPSGDVERRAVAYLAAMPASIAHAGGHDAAYAAALALVAGFALEPGTALDLLEREFNPRCEPPWSRGELEHKVASAANASRVGRGYLLDRSAA